METPGPPFPDERPHNERRRPPRGVAPHFFFDSPFLPPRRVEMSSISFITSSLAQRVHINQRIFFFFIFVFNKPLLPFTVVVIIIVFGETVGGRGGGGREHSTAMWRPRAPQPVRSKTDTAWFTSIIKPVVPARVSFLSSASQSRPARVVPRRRPELKTAEDQLKRRKQQQLGEQRTFYYAAGPPSNNYIHGGRRRVQWETTARR